MFTRERAVYLAQILEEISGVARSLPLGGGQSASAAKKYGGPGACPRENFWGPRPSDARKMRETPFSVIFCIIKMTTLNTKGRTFC